MFNLREYARSLRHPLPVDENNSALNTGTRAQRNQARQQLQRKAIDAMNRRRLIAGMGAGAILLGSGVAGIKINEFVNRDSSPAVPAEKFTGDIQSTIILLREWNNEVNKNPEKRELYFQRVASLAEAYLSDQLGYNLPERQLRFSAGVRFLENADYLREKNECGTAYTEEAVGFVKQPGNVIFINRDQEPIKDPNGIYFLFGELLHEKLHQGSNLINNPSPESTFGQKADFIKGVSFFLSQDDKRTCYRIFGGQVEEAMVQASTVYLLDKLGIKFQGLAIDEQALLFRAMIVDRVFNNDWGTVLRLQQNSDRLGLFQAVGKRQDPSATPAQQRIIGNNTLFQLFGR